MSTRVLHVLCAYWTLFVYIMKSFLSPVCCQHESLAASFYDCSYINNFTKRQDSSTSFWDLTSNILKKTCHSFEN